MKNQFKFYLKVKEIKKYQSQEEKKKKKKKKKKL